LSFYLTPCIPLSIIWIYILIMRGRWLGEKGFASLKLSLYIYHCKKMEKYGL